LFAFRGGGRNSWACFGWKKEAGGRIPPVWVSEATVGTAGVVYVADGGRERENECGREILVPVPVPVPVADPVPVVADGG
jgi:hypothetical protein